MRRIYDSPTRTFILSIARKNAKTAFIAMLLLLHLVGPESKPNSQLYSAAQSLDQAALLFAYMAKMIRMSPTLDFYVAIKDTKKMLVCPDRGTVYRALSAESSTAYGLNPAVAVHDELGQVVGPTSPLYDAIETAQGAQEEPISFIISTQATTDADLLSLLIDDALTGADPTTKVELYTAPLEPEKDNPEYPFTDKALRLANPHFDVFMNRVEVRKQAAKAKRMPTFESQYRNLQLNQRVSQFETLFPRSIWEACSGPINEDLFRTGRVYSGADLSARNDLTADVDVVEDDDGVVHVRPTLWTPEQGLEDRIKRDRVRYDVWVRDGFLQATPGPTIDYSMIARHIAENASRENLVELAFDRWRMDLLKAELSKIGFRWKESEDDLDDLPLLTKFGQGFVDMAPAIDEVEALFNAGKVRHGGHPVLRWMSWNAIVVKDSAGNRKIDKSKTTARIDGIVAMVMAIARLRAAKKPAKSFWESDSPDPNTTREAA